MKRPVLTILSLCLLGAASTFACGRTAETSEPVSGSGGVGDGLAGSSSDGGATTGGSTASGGEGPSGGAAAAGGESASGGTSTGGMTGAGGTPSTGGAPTGGSSGGGEPSLGGSAGSSGEQEAPAFGGITGLDGVWGTSFVVTWDHATDEQTIANDIVYDVYLADSSGAQTMLYVTSEPGATSLRVKGLEMEKTYFVVVRARDTDGNSSDNGDELEVTTTTEVSFAYDLLRIFNLNCVPCHSSETAGGNLRLAAQSAWSDLVNVTASANSTEKRVVPGDLDESLLYQLIAARNDADAANDETAMPPKPAAGLSAHEQALIASWITQGALNN